MSDMLSATPSNPMDAPPPAPLHPDHAHLDALIRAGVVTHLVPVNEEIDPAFIVAQMRALPEVGFVAAFQKGLFAFGCPGGLPDALAGIAKPAHPTAPEPSPPRGTDAPQLAKIQAQLADMQMRLARQNDDVALHSLVQSVETLKQETLAARPRLDQLQGQIMALTARVGSQDVSGQFDAVSADIKALQSHIEETPIGSQQEDALNKSIAVLTMLVKRVEGVAEKMSGGGDVDAETLLTLADRVDRLAYVVGQADRNDQKASAQLTKALTEIEASIEKEAARNQDTSHLDIRLDQLQRQGSDLLNTVAGQQKALTELIHRPEPEIDLSEQRADFARFAAEQRAAVDRLETAARALAAEARMPSPQIEELAERLARLPEETRAEIAKSVDLVALEDDLAGLRGAVEHLPEALDVPSIDRKLSALARRADPAATLGAQQQHLARFSAGLSGVMERLDAIAQSVSAVRLDRAELDALAESATRIETQIAQLAQEQRDGLRPSALAGESARTQSVTGRVRSNLEAPPILAKKAREM